MSPIFIIRISAAIILFPALIFSQEVKIEHLSSAVNSYGSEFNFIQVDESHAYFTSSILEGEKYQSVIFLTHFVDGNWGKGRYFDLGDSYSFANIHFPKNEKGFYFNICDENSNCKIAYKNHSSQKTKLLNKNINLINSTNTQPNFTFHDTQKVMYFVSNRDGGYGGMDIWLSVIDSNGNFGIPINAGMQINSNFDEITPAFNQFEGKLYFSSNRKGGLGGFDVYASEGKFNLWESPINSEKFNSKEDEMYLNFYNEIEGYFASNRSEAIYLDTEFCCNDIFAFKLEKKQELTNTQILHQHIPLKLYFHNDEPDSKTTSTTTEKTYKEAYISYFKMEQEYIDINSKLVDFFKEKLKENFNKLSVIFSCILFDLKQGKRVELQIKGHASPLYQNEYNINLSKRRIRSFVNYVWLYKNKIFSPYLENGSFQIIELPFGEKKSPNSVSDDPNNTAKAIFSLPAMEERKIEIIDVKVVE